MKNTNSIAKATLKILNFNIICSLLTIPLMLIMSQQAKASEIESCALYDNVGRKFMDLTSGRTAPFIRNAKDYGDDCLQLARNARSESSLISNFINNCYTPADLHIEYTWRGQLYKSGTVGVFRRQSVVTGTQTVQHCTPVGFAGGCNWSDRTRNISEEKCSLKMF
jgi:hypothetical protein